MTVVMNGTNVRPRLMSQSVAEDLGRQILDGTYPPGARLPQDQIQAAYGVSRTVCREAMINLMTKGLITAKPNAGTIVTEPTSWSLLDAELLEWAPPASWLAIRARRMFDILSRYDDLTYAHLEGDPLAVYLMRVLGSVSE